MPEKNCQLSARQMAKILKKLQIHENDIILIRRDKFTDEEILNQIRRGVDTLGLKRVLAILVDENEDIRTLNQQDMNKYGWIHIDQVNKVTNRIR